MNHPKILFSALAAVVLSFFAAAPVYADITLENNRWALLTVPADSSGSTIESLFTDDLPGNEYQQSWVLFRFDTSQQIYVQPELTDSFAQGEGFWMIQMTGSDVIIDLPENLPEGSSNNSLPCATSNGCFSSKLPASTASGNRWSMLGAPYPAPVTVNEIRFTSSEDFCNSGFDFGESVLAGYLTDNQWAYNPETEEYESLTDLATLSPWQGFWVATPPQSAPIALFLLVPNPSGNS